MLLRRAINETRPTFEKFQHFELVITRAHVLVCRFPECDIR